MISITFIAIIKTALKDNLTNQISECYLVHVMSSAFFFLFGSLITIEILDSSDVIVGEPEVLGVGVDGSHESSSVLRMLQSQSMAKLVSCHQEQTVAWTIVSKDLGINTPVSGH